MRVPSLLLACSVLLVNSSSRASTPEPLPLWPQGAPAETGSLGEERDMTNPTDGQIAGRPVIRLGNVSQPTITIFRPQPDKATGAAVLVCPGGGYHILAWDLEGTEVCEWLNSIGVTGVLLKYRVPRRANLEPSAPPLQDAQRALGMIRAHAHEWDLDENRIGILGFSAGGHLAALASTNYEQRTYQPIDEADNQSCRPDFTVLVYAAYLTEKDQPQQLSSAMKVNERTAPTFLVHAQDDQISVENPLFYYLALKNAKVPAELHVFPSGGHGYGLRPTDKAVTGWPTLAERWMRGLGVLSKK